MNNDDLIRRGDFIDAVNKLLEYGYISPSLKKEYPDSPEIFLKKNINVNELKSAINAIPAVSGEPVAKVEVWNVGGSGEFRTASGIENLPHGTELYTTPQDQSARTAKLEKQLARYECVAVVDMAGSMIINATTLNQIRKLENGTELFSLKDEK